MIYTLWKNLYYALCKCSHFWRWQIVLVRQLKAYAVGVLFKIPRINCLFYLTVITRMGVLRNQTCLCDSVNSNTQSAWRPVFFCFFSQKTKWNSACQFELFGVACISWHVSGGRILGSVDEVSQAKSLVEPFFFLHLRVPCVCLQRFSCQQFNTCTGKRSSDAVKKICVKLD